MSSLSCWRNTVREALAWRISAASHTTTASLYQTGRRHGCLKRQGRSGQQRGCKVRMKKNIQDKSKEIKVPKYTVLSLLQMDIATSPTNME